MNKQYVIATDTSRCMGCHTCAVGCIMGNSLPVGVRWLSVRTIGGQSMDTPSGKFPNVAMHYLPIQCMHCRKPPCLEACLEDAIVKREDGIVLIDENQCTNCQNCVAACPYGAISIDPSNDSVSKCNLCVQRIESGQEPQCVLSCPGRARIFGDVNDPESLVCKAIARKKGKALHPEKGTEPSFYYSE